MHFVKCCTAHVFVACELTRHPSMRAAAFEAGRDIVDWEGRCIMQRRISTCRWWRCRRLPARPAGRRGARPPRGTATPRGSHPSCARSTMQALWSCSGAPPAPSPPGLDSCMLPACSLQNLTSISIMSHTFHFWKRRGRSGSKKELCQGHC